MTVAVRCRDRPAEVPVQPAHELSLDAEDAAGVEEAHALVKATFPVLSPSPMIPEAGRPNGRHPKCLSMRQGQRNMSMTGARNALFIL